MNDWFIFLDFDEDVRVHGLRKPAPEAVYCDEECRARGNVLGHDHAVLGHAHEHVTCDENKGEEGHNVILKEPLPWGTTALLTLLCGARR